MKFSNTFNNNSVYFSTINRTCFHQPYQRIGIYITNENQNKSTKKLVLVRGLPGSGKSTLGKILEHEGFVHLEADMYFEVDGEYKYDASKVGEAHRWCQNLTLASLKQGRDVVVTNTFTQLRELTPYLNMSSSVELIEAKGSWKNTHDVPDSKLIDMAKRWEPVQTVH